MVLSLKPYSFHSALPEGASMKRMHEKGFITSKVLAETPRLELGGHEGDGE